MAVFLQQTYATEKLSGVAGRRRKPCDAVMEHERGLEAPVGHQQTVGELWQSISVLHGPDLPI
jgi:hypothetical protein